MKTVVVTGSTRGIGRGLVENFLRRDCQVVVSGRSQQVVDSAVAELSQEFDSARVSGRAADVIAVDSLQALWTHACDVFGTVDIWINNAGVDIQHKPLWEADAEDLKRLVDTNLTGILLANKVAMAGMLAQGHGQIWNMEGFGSNGMSQAGMAPYGATKRAVNYLNTALRKDAAGTNIQMCTLSPGIVLTDMLLQDMDPNSEDWPRVRRIFNILADTVETVTPWLVDGVLKADGEGAKVMWLTGPRIGWRFSPRGFPGVTCSLTLACNMDNYQIARRARIGVLIPSTNTGVEYDLQKFQLDGVSWHPSRFWIELKNWAEEAEKTGEGINSVFERFLELMRKELPPAIDSVMSAKITHLMLGMSAETFWGGLEGNVEFEKGITDQIGQLGLSTGAAATRDALHAFGVKTLAVITPYPPIGDDNVRRFFSEIGFEVKGIASLSCPSATAIAETGIEQVMTAVKAVDGDDVDAIIQCGTNLSTMDIFPTLELWLEKPMIPINVATIWHALRACGINDSITGKGRLLEEF